VPRLSDLTGKKRPDKPRPDGHPRPVFLPEMGGARSSSVPFRFLKTEIITNATSEYGNRHRWLWLTKRPGGRAEFSSWFRAKGTQWPVNLWVGTSITNQATVGRIQHLQKVGEGQAFRFFSIGPQVEQLDFGNRLLTLDRILQGGESGARARAFDVAWAVRLMRECRDHRIPYFLKRLGFVVYRDGQRVNFEDSHAGHRPEWPEDLRVREVPEM
jgi:protein gp37